MFNLVRSNSNVATNPATSPETNKSLRFAPRSSTEKSLAAELMKCVLLPTRENFARAKTIITDYPEIMFIETKGTEWASGVHNTQVKYRQVNCTPFEAAIGTGDREIYRYMAQYMENVVYKDENGKVIGTGIQLALTQLQEKFPNGFDFPPPENEFNSLIIEIASAIEKDKSLQENNTPSNKTITAIKNLREYCLPKEVTQGHHFNLNYLIEAINKYQHNSVFFNQSQNSLFWCQVIGYLQRLATGVDAQAFTRGVDLFIICNQLYMPHLRALSTFSEKSLSRFDYFSTDSTFTPTGLGCSTGLGFDFAFNINEYGSWGCALDLKCNSVEILTKLRDEKVSALEQFKKELEAKAQLISEKEPRNVVSNSFK